MDEKVPQEALLSLLSDRKQGVLVTLKRDGRPQLSNVLHAYDPQERIVRVSVTADRAKTRNLARDSRASYHVSTADGWAWTVAEGDAELSEMAADPYDRTVEELVDLYRAISGEHADWSEYRAAMVDQRRRVVRLHVRHAYGQLRR
ncbi:PPOX class F420-dependent oxidoreductase [Streptomyces sp. TR06-5]|uniref:PPOX class F420-dependent oxidoreductase n=1 Tax=unclassified Streptomyces TaxID=2593676 RepID=UPI00399F6773